jgi:hypothetical protein
MPDVNRTHVCNCATIAEILLVGRNEYIHADFVMSKERIARYFPETIKLFKWDEVVGWYHGKFFGVDGLQAYIAGTKRFSKEYEKLSWLQQKAVYFAVIDPFNRSVSDICNKLDLEKDASGIMRDAIKAVGLPRKEIVSGIRGLGYGDTVDEFNSLADSVESCLKSKQSA